MPFLTIDRNDAIRARTAASVVSDAAADLRDSASRSMSHAHKKIWTGPYRDAVVEALSLEADALRRTADRADALAEDLTAHAAWIDRETDRLDEVRSRVRNYIAANPADPLALQLATSHHPQRWNLEWDRLASLIAAGPSVLTTTRYF